MNTPRKPMVPLNLRVDEDQHRRISEIAEAEFRSVSQEVRRLIERRIAEYEREQERAA